MKNNTIVLPSAASLEGHRHDGCTQQPHNYVAMPPTRQHIGSSLATTPQWQTQGPASLGMCPGSLLCRELVSFLVS